MLRKLAGVVEGDRHTRNWATVFVFNAMQSTNFPTHTVPSDVVDSPEAIGQATQNRKADHLRACLQDDVQFRQVSSGFDRYRFEHCCLPELDRSAIDPRVPFLHKSLGAPFLISSMTGGTDQAQQINLRLAAAAQKWGFAMGVGSQRVAVERPDVRRTFAVRSVAPDILLFANLGAVQLNYRYGLEHCQELVDWLEADALILHLNPLQEAVQTKGDRNFAGLLDRIAALCAALPVPVIAKEVGNGISSAMAQKLLAAGVKAIDVAGAGGTSWAKVESVRALDPKQRRLGETFGDWGLPTADWRRESRRSMWPGPAARPGPKSKACAPSIPSNGDWAKPSATGACPPQTASPPFAKLPPRFP